jgi:hypothetical protein
MVKKEGEIKEHPSTGSQARPENDARTQQKVKQEEVKQEPGASADQNPVTDDQGTPATNPKPVPAAQLKGGPSTSGATPQSKEAAE